MNDRNITILEVKYGNIYGGPPNFFVITELALLTFETDSNKIFLESWQNTANVNIVNVYTRVNNLGHTQERVREVVHLASGRKKEYDEEFRIEQEELERSFRNLRSVRNYVKSFLLKNLRKYRINELITFDGKRDIFLCEKSGVDFGRIYIVDLQRELSKETNYLFSLNKLAVIANFELDHTYLRSNNHEYWMHPIAARQIVPKTAAYDAARLLMVHNEFMFHRTDFLMNAQRLLNKIQTTTKEE